MIKLHAIDDRARAKELANKRMAALDVQIAELEAARASLHKWRARAPLALAGLVRSFVHLADRRQRQLSQNESAMGGLPAQHAFHSVA